MDGLYKELDEVKADFEKLKADYQAKTQLNERLMRANADQEAKIREAQSHIEKQGGELTAKSEEIAEVSLLYEDIKIKLHKSESSLKQVSQVREKFRAETGEKVQNLEGANTKLGLALEEATARNEDLERKLCACSKEVEGLKSLLFDSQRKCLEAEERARAGRELRQRDDVISRLEERSMSIQDQLKWKKEQFELLEDAHKRLQDQFHSSKKEWMSEKSLLVEEVSSLQSKLDSQIRIAESLESRLKMCNQALVHEESRRKMLEIQLSESKQCFENVLAECEEAKARIESLSTKRNEEIAGLRNQLGMKETLMKEMEYRVTYLEQENMELLGSVKELQEAQINKRKPDPSLAKLRSKLRDLEQVHNNCSLTLKEREADWSSKMAQLTSNMKCYESDLKRQSEALHALKMQLDDSHSAMEICGEEISILLMVMKSELSDAYSRLFNSEVSMEDYKKEKEVSAEVSLEQARKEIESLTHKLESLKLLEDRCDMFEKELEEHKKMLENSSSCQIRLKEQISQKEVALKNVSVALEKSNSQLAVKISEASEAKMELQIWKSKAESLRSCLEKSEQICKQMETSFLEQVEKEQGLTKENECLQTKSREQQQQIDDLLQKIATLDQRLAQAEAANKVIKSEVAEAHNKEVDYMQTIKARDLTVDHLQKQIQIIEQQSESARLEAEERFECEKEKLCNIVREKDLCIGSLKGLTSSLEQNFLDMVLLSLSQGLEYLVKMNALEDSLEKTQSQMDAQKECNNSVIDELQREASDLRRTVLLHEQSLLHSKQICKELEAQLKSKNNVIHELQMEASALQSKVSLQEQSLFHSKQISKELEDQLEEKKFEMEKAIAQFKNEWAMLEESVKNLEQEREARDVTADNLQKQIQTMEQQGIKYLAKIKKLEDALEKAETHLNEEMDFKNKAIDKLQREASDLQGKVLLQERSLFLSEQLSKELEEQLEEKKLEMEQFIDQFKSERAVLEELVKNLQQDREAAKDDIKRLSSERNSLLIYSEMICKQIGEVCEDVKFETMLAKLLQNSEDDANNISDVISDQLHDSTEELYTCLTKEVEARLPRFPLREVN